MCPAYEQKTTERIGYGPEVQASELGFLCVPARVDDPAPGRWLSTEPAGAEDGSGPEEHEPRLSLPCLAAQYPALRTAGSRTVAVRSQAGALEVSRAEVLRLSPRALAKMAKRAPARRKRTLYSGLRRWGSLPPTGREMAKTLALAMILGLSVASRRARRTAD
jgi:hypothetical protein